MTKRLSLILLLGVIGGWVLPILVMASVYVDPNSEFVVADSTTGEYSPRISGSTVVWYSYMPSVKSDVFYRTLPGGGITNLTNDSLNSQYDADIFEGTVVYRDSSGIMVHPIGGTPYVLSNTGIYPRIFGNLVIWNYNGNIYGKNLSGGSQFTICGNGKAGGLIALYDDIVVWADARSDPLYNIYGKYVTGSEFSVSTVSGEQRDPEIWGDIIVWQDKRNGTWDIYGYDIERATEFPISTDPISNERYPSVCGNYVVFRNGNDIKGYSLLSGQQYNIAIASQGARQSIYGNIVVWNDDRGTGGYDIYGNYLTGDYFPPRIPALENPDVFDVTSPQDGVVHIYTRHSNPYYYPKLLVRSEAPMEWDVENGRTYPSGGVTEGIITFLRNDPGLNDHWDYDLEPGQNYYYRIYRVDDNNWYSSGWTKSIVVAGTPKPIRAPTNVWAESLDGKAIIHLTNPDDPNYASTLILRSTSPIDWKPTDGQSYSEGQTVAANVLVISNAAGTTDYLDTDLDNLQQYYYRVFAINNNLEYSIGKQVTSTPTRKPAGRLYRMLTKWGSLGTGDSQFGSEGGPQGNTIDEDGYIWVSDWGNKQLKKFTKDGQFVAKYENHPGNTFQIDDLHYRWSFYFATGKLNEWPWTYIYKVIPGHGIDSDYLKLSEEPGHIYTSFCTGLEHNHMDWEDLRTIYVTIVTEDKVKRFVLNQGTGLDEVPPEYGPSEWGESGTNPGQLSGPLSIVRGNDGFLYVGDETGRIQKFGAHGYFYEIACQLDPSKGEMPLDMAVDRWGCFYVATSAYRVLKFDPDWNFLTGWGRAGSEDGEFCRTARICVDSQDNVYVSDGDWPTDPGALQNQRVQVFTETDQHGSDVIFTGYIAEPINTATGNFTYEHTDLTVPGVGLSFRFERFYNHQDDYEGVFGKGWRHSYEMRASEDNDGSVVISWPNGNYDGYELNGSIYVPKLAGVYNTLVKNGDNTFTLTRTDQVKYNFATNGKLQSIVDRNGNSITLTYSATGKLTTITDTVGRQFNVAYDKNGRLASLTDPIGRIINYSLDPNNNLVSVADANGFTTQFFYDSQHRITKIITPRGYNLLENTYDEYNRVIEQKDAKGNSTTFDYKTIQVETPYGWVSAYAGITEVNDPLGHITKHQYDGLSRLPLVTAADDTTTESQYDSDDNRTAWTDEAENTTNYQYDSSGNVIQKTDSNGGQTDITYDSYNNPTEKTDALGSSTTYTYDTFGNLVDVNNPLGQVTHRTYFGNGLVYTVTDGGGNTTTYDYDSHGNLITVTDALYRITTYSYDAVGRKLSETNPLGYVTYYEYDAVDNLISVTDPNSRVTGYEYDENGNKTKEIYPDGNDREFVYDEMDLLIAETDEAGFETTYVYDALGHLTEVSDPCGNTTTYTYDEVGNRIDTTDARGNTTTYSYDSRGNITDVYDPNGGHTAYEYDALNRRTKIIDPLGNQARYEYDALGRVIKAIDPNGDFTTTAYDALGRTAFTTDKNGNTTSYQYDSVGNLIEVNDPNGIVTTHSYDAVGNKISTTDPLGRTTIFEYDALNRLIKVTDPLGHTTETVYDDVGRVAQKIDAKGRITKYDYDLRDRLIRVTDPAGYETNYNYDVRGNLISIVNARGKETTYEYDSLNRLVKQTNPLGLERSFEYDEVGNKTALIDEDSQTTTYSYDENNRFILESFPDGNSTSYTYDLAGRLVEMTDSVGITTYQYNNKGRLISKTDPFGQTVTYTYDAVGNKTSITYPGDKTVQYFYDQYNDLVMINDWLGNQTDYFYDDAGQLVEAQLPNGDFTVYDYDNSGRLVHQSSRTDANEPICEYTIELDEVGNRIAIDYNQPILPFPPATEEIIEYSYDDADRLISAGDVNYVFSNRGNLIQKDTGTEITDYYYDSHDWLTEVATLAEQWLYDYDGQGHRIEESSSEGTTRYVVDPTGGDMWDVTAETDDTNSPQIYYIQGYGLVYQLDAGTGNLLCYHFDPIGSTVALTDASGNIIDSYSYEEFGKTTGCSCATSNKYQYVGKFGVSTAPDELLYMRARYYEPVNGRFVSLDPAVGEVANPDSLNPYIYVINNPLLLSDPTGLYDYLRSAFGLISTKGTLIKFAGSALSWDFFQGLSMVDSGNSEIWREVAGLHSEMAWDEYSNWQEHIIQTEASERKGAEQYVYNHPYLSDIYENCKTVGTFVTFAESLAGALPGGDTIMGLKALAYATGSLISEEVSRSFFEKNRADSVISGSSSDMSVIRDDAGGYNTVSTSIPITMLQGQFVSSTGAMVKGRYYSQHSLYRYKNWTSEDTNWEPPSRAYIRERYEPKFRIINKSNAKDLRK